jgi:hypothetical protein
MIIIIMRGENFVAHRLRITDLEVNGHNKTNKRCWLQRAAEIHVLKYWKILFSFSSIIQSVPGGNARTEGGDTSTNLHLSYTLYATEIVGIFA